MQKVKADRTGNFTVINNYHLHDKNISTSAKTLMTLLLSLPEDWKLSVRGIAKILNESEYAIRRMMKELETGGYLKKEQRKDKNGRYRETEFTVYEVPQQEAPEAVCAPERAYQTDAGSRSYTGFRAEGQGSAADTDIQDPIPDTCSTLVVSGGQGVKTGTDTDPAPDMGSQPTAVYAVAQSPVFTGSSPLIEIQQTDNPHMDNPHMGKPSVESPSAEILSLQNTDNNKRLYKDPIYPYPVSQEGNDANDGTDKRPLTSRHGQGSSSFRQVKPPTQTETRKKSAALPSGELYGRYRDLILGNIGYDSLKISLPHETETIDGLVELILEVLCGTKPYIRIAGEEKPRELVKARFLRLRCDHMIYILDCLRENTSRVSNVKQYLLAVLFNAPATMEGYYTLRVGHDLFAGDEEKTS